ncbi:hypothetical protein VTL71DRAFT_5568 [Oculimacula yallundae]|uniref:Uncharacterized protein n=1 Tax=Oculimacula yallundae TaxID=86028 RepID=A0ABR4C1D7_9HELO
MAARLQTLDLVEQMKGKNTLNGWDVLVSYNEKQINDLLKVRTETVGTLSKMAFQTEEEMLGKVDWAVELSNPKLSFIGTQGRVRLLFDLAALGTPESGKAWSCKPGFAVKMETDLMNVRGSLSDTSKPASAEFVAAPDASQTAVRSNSVVQMTVPHGVCLDFDKALDVQVVSTKEPAEAVPFMAVLLNQRLREEIAKEGYKYYVAGLNNMYTPAAGATTVLTPKTFCFTTMAGNESTQTPGTLSMWIGLEGGEAGQRPSGQTSMTFHPADNDVSPIPRDSSASVIFSHGVMARYIVSSLKAKGVYTDFSVTSNIHDVGIQIKCRCNKKITKDFSQYTVVAKYEFPAGFLQEFYSNVNFDMKDDDTIFQFGKKDGWSHVDVSYMSGEQKLRWYRQHFQLAGVSPPESKELRLKFGHGGTGSWSDDRTPATKTPNLLKLAFKLDDKFHTKDPKVTEKVFFWDVDDAEAPQHYKNIEIGMPKIDFDMGGLDYFLTTNLLLPGAHLFIADDPTGKKGPNFGLFMPRDVILTGEVATEIKGP